MVDNSLKNRFWGNGDTKPRMVRLTKDQSDYLEEVLACAKDVVWGQSASEMISFETADGNLYDFDYKRTLNIYQAGAYYSSDKRYLNREVKGFYKEFVHKWKRHKKAKGPIRPIQSRVGEYGTSWDE